jgi:hypothetical protein
MIHKFLTVIFGFKKFQSSNCSGLGNTHPPTRHGVSLGLTVGAREQTPRVPANPERTRVPATSSMTRSDEDPLRRSCVPTK